MWSTIPTSTRRIGWHVGTVGGDVFTTSGNAEIAHGWDGADLITEGAGTVQIFGDGGNDTIIVTSAISANLWDGGAGLGDTINWSAVNETGATFDLKLGIATSASLSFEQMLNFENLIGTANRDIIIGNGNINFIDGGAGNDDIDGGGGADALVGGAGDDLIHGDGLEVHVADGRLHQSRRDQWQRHRLWRRGHRPALGLWRQ